MKISPWLFSWVKTNLSSNCYVTSRYSERVSLGSN